MSFPYPWHPYYHVYTHRIFLILVINVQNQQSGASLTFLYSEGEDIFTSCFLFTTSILEIV